jgi:nitrite reductase/ring-hydroxylating ferredoxin subunit/uncharacterized membrane protein
MSAQESQRQLTPLEPLVERLERASALDAAGKGIGRFVRNAIPRGALKDGLSGTWLGHAVHPMLTDVVIGSFMGASLLDVLGEDGDGAERLIAVGLAAYAPTAAAGINDWADTEPADASVRRVGLVHATGNLLAGSLYAASLVARRRGAHGRGKLLGAAGAAVLGMGGYLGGHLSLARGVGPDQTVYDTGPEDWTAVVDSSQLVDRRPVRVLADDTPVMVVRRGDAVRAIHDRCSHRGCSLASGEIDGDAVECACHGSRFALADGALRRGPATSAQPAYEVREVEGRVEVRLRPAD